MPVLIFFALFTSTWKLFKNELKEFQTDSEPESSSESISEPAQKFIQDSDISLLPEPVQRYLNYTGFIEAPKSNMTEVIWTKSKIRFSPNKKWMQLTTLQYVFSSSATRLAYMHARLAGLLPFEGRDRYHNGSGHMYGKLAKTIPIFNNRSKEVALGGAVILLAESLLEPTIAFQHYITWQPIDENTAKATLRNDTLEISGRFYFNDWGEYIRFESDDRPYDLGKGKYETKPFSINLGEYREADGYKMANRVSATWHLEGGDFTYWNGRIAGLRRNIGRTSNKKTMRFNKR